MKEEERLRMFREMQQQQQQMQQQQQQQHMQQFQQQLFEAQQQQRMQQQLQGQMHRLRRQQHQQNVEAQIQERQDALRKMAQEIQARSSASHSTYRMPAMQRMPQQAPINVEDQYRNLQIMNLANTRNAPPPRAQWGTRMPSGPELSYPLRLPTIHRMPGAIPGIRIVRVEGAVRQPKFNPVG